VAEDEVAHLSSYFVETEQWKRVWNGEIDVVYGPKGAGKSAIYATLVARESNLFDRGVLIRAAESPRGAPAFAGLVEDPPATEAEFVALWKLYFLALIADVFVDYELASPQAQRVIEILTDARLRPSGRPSLKHHIRTALEYVRRLLRPAEVAPTVEIDPSTGSVTGFSTRIRFSEPDESQRSLGAIYVDELFDLADQALANDDFKLWLLIDRLDVAFAGSPELEQNALRALFKVYLDLNQLDQIRLKIFLRSDIWRAITAGGFREASHITRELTIEWSHGALLQLIVQRLLQNLRLVAFFGVDAAAVLSDVRAQRAFFESVYPPQVDTGPNKLKTFEWCLSRTKDGTGLTAPRELIHLLNEACDVQLRRIELGEGGPAGQYLFDRASIKAALPAVSQVRLTKTLYAEYPDIRSYVEMLESQKPTITLIV
jgi:hypothetical protein